LFATLAAVKAKDGVMARRSTAKARPTRAAPPAKKFQQERSRRTYVALITAAAEVFAERGYDATGTPDIAARANVSVGTFYRYFDDKKQIYLDIIRSHSEAALRNVMAGLQPERFLGKARHETIRMAMDVLFDHVAKEGPLLRTLIETAPRDPDIAAIQRQQDDEARQRLAVLLSFVVPRAVCPDPAAMAYVIHAAATECAFTVNGLRGAPPMPAEPIKAALADMFERALFPAG
jgi:AcrR family transcriptional regulator